MKIIFKEKLQYFLQRRCLLLKLTTDVTWPFLYCRIPTYEKGIPLAWLLLRVEGNLDYLDKYAVLSFHRCRCCELVDSVLVDFAFYLCKTVQDAHVQLHMCLSSLKAL